MLSELPPQQSAMRGCVEILGGNVSHTEEWIRGGLEALLIARPAGAGGGGDVYCMHSCGHGTLAKFVLLDLTGHGQERDAIARSVHDLLHRYAEETRPARLLELANQEYEKLALPTVLAAAIAAIYEPDGGDFRFANAGQPRPFQWSAKLRQWRMVQPAEESDCGLPLGVEASACYIDEKIVLGIGDMLFLCSDGLSEARNQLDEFLESRGVLRFLEQSTAEMALGSTLAELAAAFFRRVEEFTGNRKFQDDITLLWLRRLPKSAAPALSERKQPAE